MLNVAIIGPECTGKSTFAQSLASKYKGTCVPEYARTYVERKGSTDVTYNELCELARHQIEEMESLYSVSEQSERSVICQAKPVFFDTDLIVTKVWFDYAFGQVPEWLNEAIERYPMDIYLLTRPDIPWVSDQARSNGSDSIRQELFERYEKEIQALNIPYYIIEHC